MCKKSVLRIIRRAKTVVVQQPVKPGKKNTRVVALFGQVTEKWEQLQIHVSYFLIDPPGRIGGHYFQTWCPSVRPENKKAKTKHRNTLQDNMGAGWVTKNCKTCKELKEG